jgi:hypothetical protein
MSKLIAAAESVAVTDRALSLAAGDESEVAGAGELGAEPAGAGADV